MALYPDVKQYVLALEVTMNDAALMAVFHGITHLSEPDSCLWLGNALILSHSEE